MNRVILAKALQVYASNQTLHLRTKGGDFEITPKVAWDVMKASGQWRQKRRKNNPAKK